MSTYRTQPLSGLPVPWRLPPSPPRSSGHLLPPPAGPQRLSPTSLASFGILPASGVSGGSSNRKKQEMRQKRERELLPKTHKLVPERNRASFFAHQLTSPTITRQAARGPWLELNSGMGVGNGFGTAGAPFQRDRPGLGLPRELAWSWGDLTPHAVRWMGGPRPTRCKEEGQVLDG